MKLKVLRLSSLSSRYFWPTDLIILREFQAHAEFEIELKTIYSLLLGHYFFLDTDNVTV